MSNPREHSWNPGEGCGQERQGLECLNVQVIALPPGHPLANGPSSWSPSQRQDLRVWFLWKAQPRGTLLWLCTCTFAVFSAVPVTWGTQDQVLPLVKEGHRGKEEKSLLHGLPHPPHTVWLWFLHWRWFWDKYLRASVYSPVKWGEEYLAFLPLGGRSGEQRYSAGLDKSGARPNPWPALWETPAMAKCPAPIPGSQYHVGGCQQEKLQVRQYASLQLAPKARCCQSQGCLSVWSEVASIPDFKVSKVAAVHLQANRLTVSP